MKKPRKKPRKKKATPEQMESALRSISNMGIGIKPEIIDWANIGKNAVSLAKEVLREKCAECGK
jgi:hypothetical protein